MAIAAKHHIGWIASARLLNMTCRSKEMRAFNRIELARPHLPQLSLQLLRNLDYHTASEPQNAHPRGQQRCSSPWADKSSYMDPQSTAHSACIYPAIRLQNAHWRLLPILTAAYEDELAVHHPKPAENDEGFHASAVTSIVRSNGCCRSPRHASHWSGGLRLAAYDSGRQIRA